MTNLKRGFYNHTFLLPKKKIKKIEHLLKKKKLIKTNHYWFSRQKKYYIEIDNSNSEIKVFNETNLGEKLKKDYFFLFKLIFLVVLRKFISLFIKFDYFNPIINNSYNNLDYYLNRIKILSIKKKNLKKKLNQINEFFPTKIKFFFYLDENLNIFKKKYSYKYLFEIGAGPAINACLLNYKYKTKSIIIDLYTQNTVALLFISLFFPNIKISFENYKNLIKKYKSFEKAFKYFDIIFLPPGDIKKIPKNFFNFSINLCAFQEMSKTTIKNYILETRRVLAPNNFFISINRDSKFLGFKQIFKHQYLYINPFKLILKPKLVFPKYNFSTKHVVSIIKYIKK